jgi:hypothetical protein
MREGKPRERWIIRMVRERAVQDGEDPNAFRVRCHQPLDHLSEGAGTYSGAPDPASGDDGPF